jgi:hypothetical protein
LRNLPIRIISIRIIIKTGEIVPNGCLKEKKPIPRKMKIKVSKMFEIPS